MFHHILVPLDGSALAECVLPHAVALARPFHARVTLLHILNQEQLTEFTPSVDPLEWHIERAKAQATLEKVAARLRAAGVEVTSQILSGQSAEIIIQYAREHTVDLIVLSSHGRSGLSQWNVSSVVQKIIMRAMVPVTIVRAYNPVVETFSNFRYHNVLVPLDGSQRAEYVLPVAVRLAAFHRAKLCTSHVVCIPETFQHKPLQADEEELVQRIIERNRQEALHYLSQLVARFSMEGVDIQPSLITSRSVAAALHDLAAREQVDLVILTAHGASGDKKWPFGSLTANFIAFGTTPLMVVQDLSPNEITISKAEASVTQHQGH